MRGDDQPSRYPPRGVWFGLILAAGFAGVLLGQDAPDPAGASTPTDPVVFSAQRVWRWAGADGHYLYLYGESAALQGVDGIRSREAVARIVPLAAGDDPLYQVEVYAEGAVRDTRRGGAATRTLPDGIPRLQGGDGRLSSQGTDRAPEAATPVRDPPAVGLAASPPSADAPRRPPRGRRRARPAGDSEMPSDAGPSPSAAGLPVVEPDRLSSCSRPDWPEGRPPTRPGSDGDAIATRARSGRRGPRSRPAPGRGRTGRPAATRRDRAAAGHRSSPDRASPGGVPGRRRRRTSRARCRTSRPCRPPTRSRPCPRPSAPRPVVL